MLLENFTPKPALVAKHTLVERPRFPVIDAHNHLSSQFGGGWDQCPAAELLDRLDEAGVRQYVDLDGGWGEDVLKRHLDHFKAAAPERFRMFGGVDWSQWPEQGDRFGEWAAARLRAQARRGAEGLKMWKPFGLSVRDQHGALVAVDDPRLDPLWQTAAELKLPVMIHVADPVAFFDPVDSTNERWEELQGHPDWQFPSPPFPPFISILEAFARLVQRHPQTTFIGAHVGCYAENLAWVGAAARPLPQLVRGYQRPHRRAGPPALHRPALLPPAPRPHPVRPGYGPRPGGVPHPVPLPRDRRRVFQLQPRRGARPGPLAIYGLYLPDDVLEKVYYRNAEGLFNS